MATYDWRSDGGETLATLFPRRDDIAGRSAWLGFVETFRQGDADAAEAYSTLRRDLAAAAPPRPCPRVFVSHRQSDDAYARRAAFLIDDERIEYWLDVHDSRLKAIARSSGPLTPAQLAALTAAIIEMALVNCTHALALLTPNTRGTMWVPYEYGRMVDIGVAGRRVAVWRHHEGLSDTPECIHLGSITDDEPSIRLWLQTDVAGSSRLWPSCTRRTDPWPYEIPDELPVPP
jgi:hypothetical protein